MKNSLLLILVVMSSSLAYAINVSLSSNLTESHVNENASIVSMLPNETIRFHIEVRNGGKASGSFMISRDIGNNTFMLIGKPHFGSTSCSMCTGTSDLGDITEDYNFQPIEEGLYRAEANYGGVSRRIDLQVAYPTTTTTSTTTTSTSTSTSTTTSTTSSTTTSTTVQETTSTIRSESPEKGNLKILYFMGISIVILIVFFLLAKKR